MNEQIKAVKEILQKIINNAETCSFFYVETQAKLALNILNDIKMEEEVNDDLYWLGKYIDENPPESVLKD